MHEELESSQHPSHSLAAADHQHLGDTDSIDTLHGYRQGGFHPLYIRSSLFPSQGLWLRLTPYMGRKTLTLLRSLKARKKEMMVLGNSSEPGEVGSFFTPLSQQLRDVQGEPLIILLLPAWPVDAAGWGHPPGTCRCHTKQGHDQRHGISDTHTQNEQGWRHQQSPPAPPQALSLLLTRGTQGPAAFRAEHPRYIPPSTSSFRKQLHTQNSPSPHHASRWALHIPA